jgi:NAD(P)-dependent dehydrogenase (short-subunit alcohol dehydrogenase family)
VHRAVEVNLDGKVAVVTGAASGIGRAMVQRFRAEGMTVVAADVEGECVRCDVSLAEAVEALAEQVYAEHGACHLVCANAGVFQGGVSWERSIEDWQWVLGVNLWGPIHVVRSFVPRMVAAGDEGHVVITSSMAGLTTAAFSGPYQVSKFGAYGLAESLAHDLRASGSSIGVSALVPGAVATKIGESGRNRPDSLPAKGGEDVEFVEGALQEMTETRGIDPSEVAARVVTAVQNGDFLIPTNDDYAHQIQQKTDAQIRRELPPMADFT